MRLSPLLVCPQVCRLPSALLSTILLSWLAPAAQAAVPEVTFSPVDLARGELMLPEDVTLAEAESVVIEVIGAPGRCEVAASGNTVFSSGPGTCPALWAMAEPKPLLIKVPVAGKKVEVKLVPFATPGTVALGLSGTAIAAPANFPESPELAVLIWDGTPPKPVAWEFRPLEEGKLELGAITADIARKAGGRYLAFGYDPNSEDGNVLMWPVLASAPAGVPTGPGPAPTPRPLPIDPTNETGPEPVPMEIEPIDPANMRFALQAFPPESPIPEELSCPPARLPQDDMIVVCVDATGPTMRYWQSPRTSRTKPNRPFYVHVVHRIEHRAQIVMGGKVGSAPPGSRGKFVASTRNPDGGGFNLEGDNARVPVTYVATARTFAPRVPGFAPMEVRLVDGTNALVADPFKLEFWIEETYSGAFRVGVAGIVLGALDQRFRAETRPGSLQNEIVKSDESVMDLDVVLGYSPYLDAGGRAATGCENAPFCFNPYFGLGLMSASGNGEIQWLKSVHLGFEWELSEAFAIGLTANLRRVERLAAGFRPGYPVDGRVPTDDVFVFGMGIVVNLSPEFLKIGAGGAAAVLH